MEEHAGGATPAGADHGDRPRRLHCGGRPEERGGRTGVADGAVDRSRGGSPRAGPARDDLAQTAVGIGERPRGGGERRELVDHLTDHREEDLLAEQTAVVEVAVVVLAVASVAIDERAGARDARAEGAGAAVGGQHEGNGARAAAGLEAGAGTGAHGVGRDHEGEAGRTGADGIGRTEQRLHPGVSRTGVEGSADVTIAADCGGEEREARSFGEGRTARAPVERIDDGGSDPGCVEGARGGFPRESEGVLVGAAWDRGGRGTVAVCGADLGGVESEGRRRRADRQDAN
ncbi:MAG: hypothetical protein ACKOOG_13055, partial [Actinomycetota bacterium]